MGKGKSIAIRNCTISSMKTRQARRDEADRMTQITVTFPSSRADLNELAGWVGESLSITVSEPSQQQLPTTGEAA